MYLEDRNNTLEKLMVAIRVDIGYVEVKSPDYLWEAIGEWIMWHFKRTLSFITKYFTSPKNQVTKLAKGEVTLVLALSVQKTIKKKIRYQYSHVYIGSMRVALAKYFVKAMPKM